jgi:hypothetical protein
MSLDYQINLFISCRVHMPIFQLSLFHIFIKVSLSEIQIEYFILTLLVMLLWCNDVSIILYFHVINFDL